MTEKRMIIQCFLQTLGPTSVCDRQHGIATTLAMAIGGHYSQASRVIRYHEGCFNEHSMDLEKHGGSTLIQCKQLLMSKGIVVISASLSYPWDREGWCSVFDKKDHKDGSRLNGNLQSTLIEHKLASTSSLPAVLNLR